MELTLEAPSLDRAAVSRAADLMDRLRRKGPRVHAITNNVVQTFTANALLAIGAIPSLTVAPDEAGRFAASADALLVNLGTLDADRRAAIPKAVAAARDQGVPFVIDPVFVDRSPVRRDLTLRLLADGATAIRMNRNEFVELAGVEPDGSGLPDFAARTRAVVALTGATDLVTDGERLIGIANGHPLMTRVTGMGCVAGAIMAAFLALGTDAFDAVAAGLAVTAVAGEIAAETAAGPGSFMPAFLDQLYGLDAARFAARARLF